MKKYLKWNISHWPAERSVSIELVEMTERDGLRPLTRILSVGSIRYWFYNLPKISNKINTAKQKMLKQWRADQKMIGLTDRLCEEHARGEYVLNDTQTSDMIEKEISTFSKTKGPKFKLKCIPSSDDKG